MASAEAVRAKITALKLSPPGERWVTQALYPPGDITRVAIPTRTHYPTLRIEYRPSTVVSAPAGTAGNWDLLIYSPPTDCTAFVWVAGPPGTNFEAITAPANSAYGFITSVPPISSTATAVEISQRSSAGTATNSSYQMIQNPIKQLGFRLTSKSYTAHMTASDLYNSGTVTTAQYDTKYQPEAGFSLYASRPVISCLGSVPLTEDEITSSSPYAVVAEAKHGVFVPHRLMGPTFDFVRSLPAKNRSLQLSTGVTHTILSDLNATTLTLGVAPYTTTTAGTTISSLPWWMAGVWGTAARPDDSGFDSVTTGVSIFRGLNLQSTITITAHVSMENILQVESPFRTLAGEPDEPDTRALTAYYEIASRMPHAYPASYNALGLVLPAIANAMRFIAPHLPKIWQGIKAVAPVAAPLLSGLLSKDKPAVAAAPRIRRAIRQAEQRWVDEEVADAAGTARPLPRPRRQGKRLTQPANSQRIFKPPTRQLVSRRKRR